MKEDVLCYASQIGRLDMVSLLLTVIAIALVLGGIFSFVHFKAESKRIAEETASDIVEQITIEYLERNMFRLMAELVDFEKNKKEDFTINSSTNFMEGDNKNEKT